MRGLKEARRLNEATWPVVRSALVAPSAAAQALADARRAVEIAPDGAILNTLGVAQYRAGLYEEALVTLTQSG